MKKIAILGSTGSIGTQTLEVVRNNPELQVAIIVAAIIIAGAIEGAGANIQSGLWKLRDALR